MGLRGLEHENIHDTLGQRQHAEKNTETARIEKRSLEKADEIVRGQQTGRENNARLADGVAEGDGAITVGEIMSGRVAVLSFDDTVFTAHNIFSRVKFRHLPIVNEEGGIIGVVSDRDILRNSSPFLGTVNEQSRDREIMSKKVGLIMTRTPLCATAETPLTEAIKLMNGRRISCLPIVASDGARLLGIITWKDVVRALSPKSFTSGYDTRRLRTGAQAASESARRRAIEEDNARLKSRAAESARIRALTADSVRNRSDAGEAKDGA